jgi:hypothetical protein
MIRRLRACDLIIALVAWHSVPSKTIKAPPPAMLAIANRVIEHRS